MVGPWSGEGDVYIQRVDGEGRLMWGSGGKYLGKAEGNLKLFRDGRGGVIAIVGFSKAWKVGSDGTVAWEVDLDEGTPLPEALPKAMFRLRKEGGRVYLQKLDERLNPMFGREGIQLDIGPGRCPILYEDGKGGVVIIWSDWDYTKYPAWKRIDQYACRIGPDGRLLWTVKFADDIPEPAPGRAISDGTGGVFVAFTDWMMNSVERWHNPKEVSVYLQRIDGMGMTWTSPIVLGRANPITSPMPERPRLVRDGRGGVIVSWVFGGKIYVQHVSGEGEVGVNYTSVKTGMRDVPEEFMLCQNIPNPFNSKTRIRYFVPESVMYRIGIYSLLGDRIRTLAEGMVSGEHEVEWDGKDESGIDVASGVYVYELKAGRFREVRKMMLVR